MPACVLLRRTAASLACGAAVLLLLVLAARPSAAHAALVETAPFDGQNLVDAPPEVVWAFNEPVASTTGALRVFDSAGGRVDTGRQGQPAPERLTLALREGLPSGTYVATHRVTSADGHVIRGAFVFSVGDAAEVDEDTLTAIFAGGGDSIAAATAGVARGAGYVGALLLGGAVAWPVMVSRRGGREDETSLAGRWARRGALTTAAAAVVAVPAHAALISGLGLEALRSGGVLAEALGSSVGVASGSRLAAAIVALVALRLGRRRLALIAGAAVVLSFLVDGHTRTVEPTWLLMAGDAAHLLAGAVWFGGLVVLAAAVRARRAVDDPVGAAEAVARFSRIATWSLAVVVVAGSAMAWALVRQPRSLISTEYGWTLVVKVVLVVVVILLGAYNNVRLVPAIGRAAVPAGGSEGAAGNLDVDAHVRAGRDAWTQLRRTVRLEVGVLAGVLAVTAVLVNLRPAAEAAGITAPFDTLVAIDAGGLGAPGDGLQLNLVVDPNRAGFNDVHFYILDRSGRPVRDLDSVRVELTQIERDIGPIVREPFVAGSGHWQLSGGDLAVPGPWVVELVLGFDRFTESRVTVPVVVNP